MEKFFSEPFPEIVFGTSDSARSKAIGRAIKAGKLRKLASRIYTSNLDDTPEAIIIRNTFFILGELFPSSVLSFRTALEGKASPDGTIFLTYQYTKKFRLPGLTVRLIQGHGPLAGDTLFMGKLYLASRPRAFLENLQSSRSREGIAKTVGREKVEQLLENLCRIHGEQELNRLRDQAKPIAKELKLEREYKILNKLIGAILGTNTVKELKTEAARARAVGEPYDPYRIELFAKLAAVLKTHPIKKRENTETTPKSTINLAFFEVYFSNYIEGTEFLIEEAADIIFRHKIIAGRQKDTHDILGTYQIVSSKATMKQVPHTVEELVKLLQQRHFVMMKEREDIGPGRFKEKTNRAGDTVFVAPELVLGTLKNGFELYTALEPGIARAMFMMFLISEVHPFADGNGRIARIMMNAELVAAGESRIIIPTVYRDDYILALRCLSRLQDSEPYVRMLDRAQRFTASIDFSTFETALHMLQKSSAFLEPHEGKLRF